MSHYSFRKELYSKVALLKAAYSFTDRAYIHLDADDQYYHIYVSTQLGNSPITEEEVEQEMLAQSLRHEIYLQTKDIRELLLGRALATSIVTSPHDSEQNDRTSTSSVTEEEILKDWFGEQQQ